MTSKTASNTLKVARTICAVLSLTTAVAISAAPVGVLGALLRQGNWNQDVGSFGVPQAWEKLAATSWPMDGWATLVIDSAAAIVTVQPLSIAEAGHQLRPIVNQLVIAANPSLAGATEPAEATPEVQALERIPAYVRVPGLTWQPRIVELYRFKNGTPQLTPELDHRFELSLKGRAFAFALQNGFRTKDGRPYGDGTQFHLEVDGQRFDYDLGGYGWDVRIEAIGDFDGDGKPDFLFGIGGTNSSYEALILSSQARPGRNMPTAYLASWGC